jgi:hypothetical protein
MRLNLFGGYNRKLWIGIKEKAAYPSGVKTQSR